MSGELRLLLLGGLRIVLAGEPLTGFVSSKAPALFAYLAVTRRPHQRESLAALLWGDLPDVDARNNLRQALSSLRRELGPYLIVDRHTVAFDTAAPAFVDVEAFEQCLRSAQAATTAAERIPRLQAAGALYEGDLLAGFGVRDAPEFEEWLLPQRARLRELAMHALHALTQLHLQRGDPAGAIETATRLLGLDSWREEAHRQLMLALARSGQRSAALAQFEACRRLLAADLAVEPSADTTALYERIRAARTVARQPLPAPSAPLLGRASDVEAVVEGLLDPHCRLLTLTGMGGAGKTRLAQAAAARLEDSFLHGVCWVAAATAASGARLPATLAGALRLSPSGDAPERQVVDYLAEKEMLLVLDGLEHVAGDPAVADLLAALLGRAPEVKLLVTSRERLNLEREWIRAVEPLDAEAAVEVFRHYARRVAPASVVEGDAALAAIRRVCDLTGRLPLALVLAGAWARTMACDDIAAALERGTALLASTTSDASERHRSIHAVLEQSWQRLPPEAALALAALGVFRGGFTPEAARAVAGAPPQAVEALVDQSWLLRPAPRRYDLHDLVRQFARARLEDEPGALQAALERHRAFYAALLAEREPHLRTPRQADIADEFRAELENVRLMWQTIAQAGDADAARQAAQSSFWLFDVLGRVDEGVALFRAANAALRGRQGLEGTRGRLLARLGSLERLVGEYDTAERTLAEAEALAGLAGDRINQVFALRQLAFFLLVRGDVEAGVARLSECVESFRAADDPARTADSLISLGIAEARRGNYRQAAELHQQGADLLRSIGDEMGLSVAYSNLGDAARYQGELPQALAHYRAGADIARRVGDLTNLAISLNNMASVLDALADWDAALLAAQEALDLFRTMGSRDGVMNALHAIAGALLGQGQVEAARARFEEALDHGLRLHAETELLNLLVFGGTLLAAAERHDEAALLLTAIARHPAATPFTADAARSALDRLPPAASERAHTAAPRWSVERMAQIARRGG